MSLNPWVRSPLQKLRNRLKAWTLRSHAARFPGLNAELASDSGALVCPTCATETCNRIGRVEKTHAGSLERDNYVLAHCERCDAVYLLPPPSAADLRAIYEESDQFSDAAYSGKAESRRLVTYYSRRLQLLGLFPASGESVLEVGAGLAWIAKACHEHDPAITTVAQDVSRECADRCPWVDDYRVGTISVVPAVPAFSLVSMTHVIEHLLDPAAMLDEVAARLRPGGRIYITAPYRPPLWKPSEGLRPWLAYSYLHVPAHISYLSRTWFALQCNRMGDIELVHWDDSHDGHQAFEAVLRKRAA